MRPRDYENEQGTHNRHSRRVDYTGYRERVMVTARRPVMWRRIVVWSYIRIGNATPVIGTDSNGNDFFKRNVTPVVGNSTSDIREFLFAGTQGPDFSASGVFEAPLNRDHYSVAYDKVRVINPSHAYPDGVGGQISWRKFWNPGGKIVYDEDEKGSSAGDSTGWSVYSNPSRGNMYIFDIFGDGGNHPEGNPAEQIGKFRPVGQNYWREP